MRHRRPQATESKGQPTQVNGIRIDGIRSWACLPQTGVILVLGYQGGGKSALAWWLIEQLRQGRVPGHRSQDQRPVLMYRMPQRARGLLPSYVQNAPDMDRLKRTRGAYVYVDETSKNAPARRSMSDDNMDFVELNAVSRQNGHTVFYLAQHSSQPDRDIVASARLVLHKLPTVMHLRFARPEIRPELDLARSILLPMSENERRKHTVVIDYKEGTMGTLRNGLPSFWSEVLSSAFAGVDAAPARIQHRPQPSQPRREKLRIVR